MSELSARQEEIIDTAIKLIDAGGIQNLTMKNIARQMGFSEPAIYRHFESKLDLLLAMLARFKLRSQRHLSRARALEGSGLQKLAALFLEHAGQFDQHPYMTAVVFSEEAFQDDQRLADAILAVMNLAHETVVEIIGNAQQNGEIRQDIPQKHLALMLLGTLRLLVKRWRMSGYAFDLMRACEEMWESLRRIMAVENGIQEREF